MSSGGFVAEVHHILDDSSTLSSPSQSWPRPENTIHLVRLCVILNLEAAKRALPIAYAAFAANLAKVVSTENSSFSLQSARRGQENAKGVLDILKYVRASLQKGVVIAKTQRKDSQSDMAAFETHVSDCISFWTSHGVYDPSQIHAFMTKIIEFYDHHPHIFGERFEAKPDNEVKTLRTLLASARKEAVSDDLLGKASHHRHHSDDRVSTHVHHSGLHLGSTMHHFVSALDIRHYVHNVSLPSIFHHKDTLDHHEGLNLDGLTGATELAFHLIEMWCTHNFQSSSHVLEKVSSEMLIYVRAIDLSIGSARSIFTDAEEALALINGLAKDAEVGAVADSLTKIHEKAIRCLRESQKSLDLFKGVRKSVIQLASDARQSCEDETTTSEEKLFEIEHNEDVLRLFENNVELYVDWWNRMNMELNCQENASKQLFKLNSAIRQQQIIGQWEDLKASFARYADKTTGLQDIFPDLFEPSRKLLDAAPHPSGS